MGSKILIVDDEREIADVVELYLKNENYEVIKCYNGTDALKCVEENTPDMALLDVMLPDIDGFTILQKIRENYTFPVIMLTAKTEYMDKINGLTLGADDYISKPFDPAELVARVNANLRQYQRMVEKFANKGPDASEEIQVQDLRILAGWDRNIRKCCKFGWNRTYTDKKGPQYPGLA